ncbi:MAG TPA: glutamate--tRNA ligase [Limnochordia bacterium]|nr:glutamate--tRNA ligase [Limnochordia bacterium]
MNQVRVRFAPSPTGYLHVGGARTALFNYLYARHHQGVFVLRIEDTDLARSTDASTQAILEAMKYLGLDWDEGPEKGGGYGPYFQSERLDLYRRHADKLLDSGRAYYCFCTPEELDQIRQDAVSKGRDPKYDGRCRNLTEAQQQQFINQGRKPVVRFKADYHGSTLVDDLIRGKVTFDNNQLDDFVLVKSDGMPTYNFAVVVDDALMRITHVIRGEDHLSNTPKQIQLYEAFGFAVPRFAHIPMILGPDRARLSKRHGATSVGQFQEEGYLADAMVNYLALLGWSYDDSQTLFREAELVEKFTLAKVSKNPAVFDLPKLQWMNGVYIRELSLEQFYQQALPFFQSWGFVPQEVSPELESKVKHVLRILQERIKVLSELKEASYYFFQDQLHYDEKAVQKVLDKEGAVEILHSLLPELLAAKDYTQEKLEPIFRKAQEQHQCKLATVIQPVRVAVTGTNVSPGIYDVLAVLGRAKTCQRIKDALELIKQRQGGSASVQG